MSTQQLPAMRLSSKKLSEERNPPPLSGELIKAMSANAASMSAVTPRGNDAISNM